jgi:hypothetical protein
MKCGKKAQTDLGPSEGRSEKHCNGKEELKHSTREPCKNRKKKNVIVYVCVCLAAGSQAVRELGQ